jgi:hypothetical protein
MMGSRYPRDQNGERTLHVHVHTLLAPIYQTYHLMHDLCKPNSMFGPIKSDIDLFELRLPRSRASVVRGGRIAYAMHA